MARDRKTYLALFNAIDADDREAVEAVLRSVKKPAEYANAKPRDGEESPLHHALLAGRKRVIEPLLEAGAGLGPSRTRPGSALEVVAGTPHAETLDELLRLRPEAWWSSEARSQALDAAASQNRPEVMDLLPIEGVPEETLGSLAAFAAMCGHAAALAWFLAEGVPVETRDARRDDGQTLLHRAAAGGQAATVAVLLRHEAEVDARDARGRTPLMLACVAEPRAVAERPAQAAKLRRAYAEGRVGWAAASAEPAPEGGADTAFGLLVGAGAGAQARDEDGNDAKALMLQENRAGNEPAAGEVNLKNIAKSATDPELDRLAEELEDAKPGAADRVWATQERVTAELVRAFEAVLRRGGATGRSQADKALVEAVQRGDVEEVEAALADGASVQARIRINNGFASTSPLGFAAPRNKIDLVRVLLAAGAQPDEGEKRMTPLAHAALCGYLEMVDLLLEAGADPNGKPGADAFDRPLEAAQGNGKLEVVARLKAAGAKTLDKTEPFRPGIDFGNEVIELVVRVDGGRLAAAVAEHLGGQAEEVSLESTVTAAERVGAIVVQLMGSAWSSVLPHVGFVRYPDERWLGVAGAVSSLLGVPAILLFNEDTGGSYEYRVFERGGEVERYWNGLDDSLEEMIHTFFTERGTPEPEDPEGGHATLHSLAVREGFATFENNPGGSPGEPFCFAFPGDRRPLAGGWYVNGA